MTNLDYNAIAELALALGYTFYSMLKVVYVPKIVIIVLNQRYLLPKLRNIPSLLNLKF